MTSPTTNNIHQAWINRIYSVATSFLQGRTVCYYASLTLSVLGTFFASIRLITSIWNWRKTQAPPSPPVPNPTLQPKGQKPIPSSLSSILNPGQASREKESPTPISINNALTSAESIQASLQKKPLGKGVTSYVYEHINPNFVIKVGKNLEQEEFDIGYRLDHPQLTKMIHFESTNDTKLIIMEKINGHDITPATTYFIRNMKPIPNEMVLKMLKQAKSCCLYLYDQKVIWKDNNTSNLFCTNEGLKICDYGSWREEPDHTIRYQGLLLGSVEIVAGLLAVNFTVPTLKILFPTATFPGMTTLPGVITSCVDGYDNIQWFQSALIDINDEENNRAKLGQYFDEVIAAFCQTQNLYL